MPMRNPFDTKETGTPPVALSLRPVTFVSWIRLEGNSKYFPNWQTYVALRDNVCNQRYLANSRLTERVLLDLSSYKGRDPGTHEFRIDDKHWLLKLYRSMPLPLSPFTFTGTSSTRCLWISLFSALLTNPAHRKCCQMISVYVANFQRFPYAVP